MNLRSPAVVLDLECIGIGPDGDKPAALCPWTARIVSAALMIVQDGRKLWLYDSTLVDIGGQMAGVNSVGCAGEGAVVRYVHSVLDEKMRNGCLVTFNGRGYDLPVLIAAATRNGLPLNAHATRAMWAKRWEQDPHFDLCEILSFNGAATKASLRAVCVGLGLTDPKSEAEGCKVAEWVAARNGGALREYNIGDVVACAGIVGKMEHWFDRT